MLERYKLKLLLKTLVLRDGLSVDEAGALSLAWGFSGLSRSDKERGLDMTVQSVSVGTSPREIIVRQAVYHVYSQRGIFETAERRFNDYLKPFLDKTSACYLLRKYFAAKIKRAREEMKAPRA